MDKRKDIIRSCVGVVLNIWSFNECEIIWWLGIDYYDFEFVEILCNRRHDVDVTDAGFVFKRKLKRYVIP